MGATARHPLEWADPTRDPSPLIHLLQYDGFADSPPYSNRSYSWISEVHGRLARWPP